MVEQSQIYNIQDKNSYHKAMMGVIIVAFTVGTLYALIHFIVPSLNARKLPLVPPPDTSVVTLAKAKEEENQEPIVEEIEVIRAPAQVLEPPKDYTVIESGDLSEEEKLALLEIVSKSVPRYAIAPMNVISEASSQGVVIGHLNEGDCVLIREIGSTYDKIVWNRQIAYVRTSMFSDVQIASHEVELPIRKLDPGIPMVALTFDDGPNPVATPRILDTLEQYGVVATFFDLGNLVERFPEITKREEEIGCTVGSHSYAHKNMNKLTPEEVRDDLAKSNAAFEKALGHVPVLYRPPYGNINVTQKEEINCPFITWNVDSLDWKYKNKNKNMAQIRKTTNFDGHIILMHSIYTTTADTVEVLIPELIENGYQFVTVQELAYYKKGINLRTRNVYNGF